MGDILARLLRQLGFAELIKLSGKKNFDQLTRPEVGLMIEAFLEGDDEFFDPLAFNDFLHARLQNDDLKKLQEELNKNAFLPARRDEWPLVNREYLKGLVKELQAKPNGKRG
jgi:hypothetical protein